MSIERSCRIVPFRLAGSIGMRAPLHPDDVIIPLPFAPPASLLKRRTIHAPDRGAADRKIAALRARMHDQGQRLVAASTREASSGLTVELVFAART
jgi:hypothetical protein